MGRIDLHSHVLPGIDDGCADPIESLHCIQRLTETGYVGSVCTPHVWPNWYPHITVEHIAAWVAELRQLLESRGVEYGLWPGGELRAWEGVVDYIAAHGVPTLADSRLVLFDFWEPQWPGFVDELIDYLFAEGYTPVLAHPERSGEPKRLMPHLDRVQARGVLLQGNLGPLTGADGRVALKLGERLLQDGRYDLMALDMHGVDTIEPRLAGIARAEELVGAERVRELTELAPRRLVFGESGDKTETG